jgi:hypothetical protein
MKNFQKKLIEYTEEYIEVKYIQKNLINGKKFLTKLGLTLYLCFALRFDF